MTVFLSKLVLNPDNPDVYRDISNCAQMHRTICSAFDDLGEVASPRSQYNLLYRLENDASASSISVLVQCDTDKPPVWERINETRTEKYVVATQTTSMEWLFPLLAKGITCRFRLHANPVKRPKPEKHLTDEDKKNYRPGKTNRIPISSEERLVEWLMKQGRGTTQFPGHGFNLVKAVVAAATKGDQTGCGYFELLVHAQRATLGKPDTTWLTPWNGKVGRNLVRIQGVTFDGVLMITDKDKFTNALKHGVGPAKAYGCGLLSVLPFKNETE